MKMKLFMAVFAMLCMFPLFGTAVYAAEVPGELPPIEETVLVETLSTEEVETPEAPPVEEAPAEEPPVVPATEIPGTVFTPAGTGTVVDYATGADGKDFYTIMTPAENVFYLVIDRQRGQQNVYFLNAVTEADLLALAEMPAPAPIPEPAPAPTEPQQAQPEPMPEAAGGVNVGMLVAALVVVALGGGAGWYLKVYRPKQQQAARDEEFAADEADPYEGAGADAVDDAEDGGLPWYDEEDDGLLVDADDDPLPGDMPDGDNAG